MRKIKLYIAISLDGYVADKNGGIAWLNENNTGEDVGSYPEFIKSIDTVILGHSTYHQIVNELSPNEWPYKGLKTYVLTHKKLESTDEIIFTSEDIKSLAENIKAKEGKDIWICGGANIAQQFYDKNLIDAYTLSIMPVILGDGIKLFAKSDMQSKLKLISANVYNGYAELEYEKR